MRDRQIVSSRHYFHPSQIPHQRHNKRREERMKEVWFCLPQMERKQRKKNWKLSRLKRGVIYFFFFFSASKREKQKKSSKFIEMDASNTHKTFPFLCILHIFFFFFLLTGPQVISFPYFSHATSFLILKKSSFFPWKSHWKFKEKQITCLNILLFLKLHSLFLFLPLLFSEKFSVLLFLSISREDEKLD